MQIWADFMARFRKNNAAKNRHVCQVEKWRRKKKRKEEKEEKLSLGNEKKSWYEQSVKEEVNQQSVNWIQVP